jgi:energy-coupling factor transport system permease protein
VRPGPAAAVFASLGAAALLAERWVSVLVIAALLVALCLLAPTGRRRLLYLYGAGVTALSVFLLTPFVETIGSHVLWTGPTVPVVGTLDLTREELAGGAVAALRLLAVSLSFAAYALLLDHDQLLRSLRAGRRSVLTVALATRLVPTLERDAAGLLEALRGRGVQVAGARGHARLLSPLLAGSLERAYNLAEAMESRGFGRTGATRASSPSWGWREWVALVASVALVVGSVLWL